MKSAAWERRERRVRIDLVKDLIRLGMLECRTVSQRRSTSLLPATIEERQKVANAETVTMATTLQASACPVP